MSKFRHIQIKNVDEPKKRFPKLLKNTNSRNATKFMDNSGSKTTKHGNFNIKLTKSSALNEKRVKRISKDAFDYDSKKVRFISQAQRKVGKSKEESDTTKKVLSSFVKRKVNPQNIKISKTIDETKKTKTGKKLKKNKDSDDDNSDSENNKDIVVNKNFKKMKTVVCLKSKKTENASKKILTRNRCIVKPIKMYATFYKVKINIMDGKSKETKKDKNYLTKK
jgi:hypothetical protein